MLYIRTGPAKKNLNWPLCRNLSIANWVASQRYSSAWIGMRFVSDRFPCHVVRVPRDFTWQCAPKPTPGYIYRPVYKTSHYAARHPSPSLAQPSYSKALAPLFFPVGSMSLEYHAEHQPWRQEQQFQELEDRPAMRSYVTSGKLEGLRAIMGIVKLTKSISMQRRLHAFLGISRGQ